ncbi:MAG: class I SAM-dependent methyltransferase [Phormidium sp.]
MDDSNLGLREAIANQITSHPQKRITFAEYMNLALYHPEQGYYATNQVNIGPQGDFFTSPHLGADFGELLARQFCQMWEVMSCPVPFILVEMGAGQGILAGDILGYLHKHHFQFFSALDYIIVEKSSALRLEQQQRLSNFPLRWCEWEEIPGNSLVGCCFSNELIDAFPVRQVIWEKGILKEVYVSLEKSGEFVEVVGETSTNRLVEYFDLLGIDFAENAYPEGYRTEVNLLALDWLSMIAKKIHRGYLLTIDYGYPAHRYYSLGRSQGTLQCYYRHSYHNDPYINIGRQDITAHVDFTALEKWGELCGLRRLGFTQQGLFLMALGLGDRIAAISDSNAANFQDIQKVLQRRDALHQMINPIGLGGFGVLLQCRGLTEEEIAQPLQGFTVPKREFLGNRRGAEDAE